MVGINTDAIFSAPIRIILGEKRRELDDWTFKRLRFLCFAIVVGFTYAGALFISDLRLPYTSYYSLALDTILMSAAIAVSTMLRYSNLYRLAFYISIVAVGVLIPAGYFAPTGNRTIFLAPVVLIVAYFLLGRIGGIVWTVYMLAAHLFSYELGQHGIAHISVSGQSLAYSSLSVGITSVLLFIYEGVNISNERRIAERDKRLRAAFDDINSLNAQLKQEKASIEKQVELRTYQLHEEQARLRASIATLELGFLITFKDQSIITYNPALSRVLELPENVYGVSLRTIYDKIGQSYDLRAAILKCISEGKPFEANDIELGSKFIRILGSAIHFQSGSEVLGVVLLFEDRTAAKVLERSENEFVAIASHELRTPLTIIQGNISLIETMFAQQMTDTKMRRMMDSVKQSTARMIAIVNQFLTMARLEQKRTTFDLKAVDVARAINETVTSIRPLIDEKGLQLRVDAAPHLPKAKADYSRFQEVLANLVSNAIKYTDSGHITVSAEHEGNNIIVRVADTGRGISPNNQQLLFRKFQQATDSVYTRDVSRSTGLGLYISKLLVEQMGGTIELEHSAEHKGSVFRFKLPAV